MFVNKEARLPLACLWPDLLLLLIVICVDVGKMLFDAEHEYYCYDLIKSGCDVDKGR